MEESESGALVHLKRKGAHVEQQFRNQQPMNS